MKKIIYIMLAIILTVSVFMLTGCETDSTQNDKGKFKIATSFYPMYIATLNITKDIDSVTVTNMTDEELGCAHNYTLKASDLVKLEDADILIQNGKGVEPFIDKVKETYPNLNIVDSSKNLQTVYKHDHGDNAHVWVNTENYIEQVKAITNELCTYNPENVDKYKENSQNYIDRIQKIQEKLKINNKITAVTFEESFEYLQNDKFQITCIETNHEESSLSAEQLSSLVDKMKNENIKYILVQKGEENKNAQVLASETGATIYELDAYTKGTVGENAYIDALEDNIQTINKMGEKYDTRQENVQSVSLY